MILGMVNPTFMKYTCITIPVNAFVYMLCRVDCNTFVWVGLAG